MKQLYNKLRRRWRRTWFFKKYLAPKEYKKLMKSYSEATKDSEWHQAFRDSLAEGLTPIILEEVKKQSLDRALKQALKEANNEDN